MPFIGWIVPDGFHYTRKLQFALCSPHHHFKFPAYRFSPTDSLSGQPNVPGLDQIAIAPSNGAGFLRARKTVPARAGPPAFLRLLQSGRIWDIILWNYGFRFL